MILFCFSRALRYLLHLFFDFYKDLTDLYLFPRFPPRRSLTGHWSDLRPKQFSELCNLYFALELQPSFTTKNNVDNIYVRGFLLADCGPTGH